MFLQGWFRFRTRRANWSLEILGIRRIYSQGQCHIMPFYIPYWMALVQMLSYSQNIQLRGQFSNCSYSPHVFSKPHLWPQIDNCIWFSFLNFIMIITLLFICSASSSRLHYFLSCHPLPVFILCSQLSSPYKFLTQSCPAFLSSLWISTSLSLWLSHKFL